MSAENEVNLIVNFLAISRKLALEMISYLVQKHPELEIEISLYKPEYEDD